MPHYDNNLNHGDLYVTFDVEFPRGSMTNQEKEGESQLV